MTYYNEFDPKAAAWLRELIRAGHIPAGDVDERSINDVRPDELTGYRQQHFFAGIGGWAFALRLAGWPDDRPVRTGSCPCQPFSAAGKGLGEEDERHLWPVFRDLITFGAPTVTFGEQVASAASRVWLARVRADLEGLGYAVGAADLCSAGVGSPNIRQRLYWMADARHEQAGRTSRPGETKGRRSLGDAAGCRTPCGLAYANGGQSGHGDLQRGGQHGQQPADGGAGGVADVRSDGREQSADEVRRRQPEPTRCRPHGFWSDFDLLLCTDGKARRIEPGSFPLAHGIPGRVGLLRGYGNAINPWLAAEFILACEEALN